jgi:RimJ/RimL family protein N-acetyltransferase
MIAMQDAGSEAVELARLEPSDAESLRRLFERLSPETRYRRFMSPVARPDQVHPERLLDVDHRDREAVVAVDGGEIVGVARYARPPGSDTAEVAVVVADAWQHRGLGTRILRALARLAAAAGVEQFTLTMQADNQRIICLVRQLDPSVRLTFSYGTYEAVVPVAAWTTGNGRGAEPPQAA